MTVIFHRVSCYRPAPLTERTYPALLVLPASSRLANGEVLDRDRLLAMAEARRDGALDTGVIDLVMKVSMDGGQTWQPQQVICRYQQEELRGKCGNATPVFDRTTGRVVLAYNTSGIPAPGNGVRPHSALVRSSEDGGITWSEALTIAGPEDDLVLGPGHGIQKVAAPSVGRLIIPGYLPEQAVVVYSDDHGQSWQRGSGLNTGNETGVNRGSFISAHHLSCSLIYKCRNITCAVIYSRYWIIYVLLLHLM